MGLIKSWGEALLMKTEIELGEEVEAAVQMEQMYNHRIGEVMLAVLSLFLGPGMDHDEASRARDPQQLPYRS
jgi:hypothetical protein